MTKINQILVEWKPGDVHSLNWFRERDIPQNLAYLYYKKGSLTKIGPGIYARKNEKLNWAGGVRLLQEELGKKIHVSGRTALELQGITHYTPLGEQQIKHLTTYEKATIPGWFKAADFSCEFNYNVSTQFPKEMSLTENIGENGISVKSSSRELAILEFIDTLDLTHSFETADNYLSSLTSLRAEVLQELLEKCSSVKVKRVFLYLAERLSYQYFSHLDISKIDLGSGKRQIVLENGKYDKKYLITVPADDRKENF